MSFALEIKREILGQRFSIENAKALIAGLVSVAGQLEGDLTIVKLNNAMISLELRLMMQELKIDFEASSENKNYIVLKHFEPIRQIKLPAFYFAGAFLGGGSISDEHSTFYHLEIQVHQHQNALLMSEFLSKYDFNFTLIQRRKMFVLYLKKSEQISNFLRAIQAFKALLKFEDARIQRDFKNQLNRYSNLDVYNQMKLASASEYFILQYQFVITNHLESHFSYSQLLFYKLKHDNQFSSLSELVTLFNAKSELKKTRSGLNHYLIKLRNFYEDYAKNY